MPYTIIYFLFASIINKSVSSKLQKNSAIIGALAPLLMHNFLYNPVSHSIFLPILAFLLFEVVAIVLSRDSISFAGKGLATGLCIHFFIDLFLCSEDINFLWPILETTQSSLTIVTEHYIEMNLLLLSLEFLGFRYILWSMLSSSVCSQRNKYYVIYFINFFYKLSLYLFILIALAGLLWTSSGNIYIDIVRYSYIFFIVMLQIITNTRNES